MAFDQSHADAVAEAATLRQELDEANRRADLWRRDRNALARQCADLRDELDTAKTALTTARENSDQAWRDAHTLFATIREADRTIVEAVLPLVAASKRSTAPRTPAYEALIEAVDCYLAAVEALPPEMRP